MVTRYLSCGSLSISGLTAPLLSRYSKSYFGSTYTALFMQLCPCLLAANSFMFALEQTTPSILLPPMQLLVFRPNPLHLTRPLQKLQKVIFLPISRSFQENETTIRLPHFLFITHHVQAAGAVSPQGSSAGCKKKYYSAWKCAVLQEETATALCQEAGIHWNMWGHVPAAGKTYIFVSVYSALFQHLQMFEGYGFCWLYPCQIVFWSIISKFVFSC